MLSFMLIKMEKYVLNLLRMLAFKEKCKDIQLFGKKELNIICESTRDCLISEHRGRFCVLTVAKHHIALKFAIR